MCFCVAWAVVVDSASWLAGVLSLLSTDKQWTILGYSILICGFDCGIFLIGSFL